MDTTHSDAGLGQRVGAQLLDLLIVALPLFIIGSLLFGSAEAGDGSFEMSLTGLPFLFVIVLVLAYFFALESRGGQTLGKKIVGIRVVSDNGGELTAGPVLVRTLMRIVDGFAFYAVGFFVALANSKNQRVGDMAASTRVVKAR